MKIALEAGWIPLLLTGDTDLHTFFWFSLVQDNFLDTYVWHNTLWQVSNLSLLFFIEG